MRGMVGAVHLHVLAGDDEAVRAEDVFEQGRE